MSRLDLRRASWLTVFFMLAAATAAEARSVVDFPSPYPAGAIVISQGARKLYLIIDSRRALAYSVAVAKPGEEWSGFARVDGKYVSPAWSPPESVKRDRPELPI